MPGLVGSALSSIGAGLLPFSGADHPGLAGSALAPEVFSPPGAKNYET